jgi:hypothetical protein
MDSFFREEMMNITRCQKMENKVIAIHQPNLFPWLGYFAKIASSDIFVFLDHTVNNRTEATYTRRVQLLNTQGEASYLTIPIKKITDSDFGPICQWQINFSQAGFPGKQLESIRMVYKKHSFYREVLPFVEEFFDDTAQLSITERNMYFIKSTCDVLKINTPFFRSSELGAAGESTELLINIVQSQNGTHYLSGKGGDNYQDPARFEKANIILERQGYDHPLYTQVKSKTFVPGLSIIDCLMNCGFEETARLIKKTGIKK